jgi:predicted nucleic acid-binding protein
MATTEARRGRWVSRSSTSGRVVRPPKPPARFLIDTSVWARLATTPEVVEELKKIVELVSPTDLLVCPPVALEYGFTAPSGKAHSTLMAQLDAFGQCDVHPDQHDVLDIQSRLWNGGLLRAAGAIDTLIAAYAMTNGAAVLHYDRDFEHIASVVPGFAQRWILPRGSI